MNYRKAALTFIVCLICVSNVRPQSPTTTTEQQVINILNSMDRAARRKDVAGMMAPLADDVRIRLTVSASNSNEKKVLFFTKDEYAQQTKMAFKIRFKYALERKNIKVEIYDEGKAALVTSELYESISTARLVIRTATSETLYLTERDGKLLVTSVDSNSRLY